MMGIEHDTILGIAIPIVMYWGMTTPFVMYWGMTTPFVMYWGMTTPFVMYWGMTTPFVMYWGMTTPCYVLCSGDVSDVFGDYPTHCGLFWSLIVLCWILPIPPVLYCPTHCVGFRLL